MKEHPILFSTPMVKAILDGKKTQTRRIVKPQPSTFDNNIYDFLDHDKGIWLGAYNKRTKECNLPCPYGQVGGRLWVRETWQDYCPIWQGAWCGHGTIEGIKENHQPVYFADPIELQKRNGVLPKRWKPSIFMPRWASRITLEITGIRVERLQDITEEDAIAEGIIDPTLDYGNKIVPTFNTVGFHKLWDSINAKTYPWESNPWVWVIEFKKESL